MLRYINEITEEELTGVDRFLIDTNVLIMLHCNELTERERKLASGYSNFISHVRSRGCVLCVSALNIQELFHVVERIYFNIYKNSHGDCSLKAYRRVESERSALATIQRRIWVQIREMYQIIDAPISVVVLEQFLASYEAHCYDPVDFFITTHTLAKNIITSDTDFDNVTGIDIFRNI